MTLREKLAEVNPDLVGERFTKGVSGCPYNYDFLHVDDLLCEVTAYHPADILDVCRECWNREYVPAETVDHPEHYRMGHDAGYEEGFRAGFKKAIEAMTAECKVHAERYQKAYMEYLESAARGNRHSLDTAAFFYEQKMMYEYEIPKVIEQVVAMMGDGGVEDEND